jgi:phosphatidylserine/phosphatidylglycerophosphate/cardiolipin synthase-like enzyme
VAWSSTSFTYTHQKTITVDNKASYISTGNFDTTYYATSRDYGVLDTDAADVSAITAVFNADYAHSAITPSDGTDLVWSPTDSQARLLALINGATKSLDVEQEEFSDTALINGARGGAQPRRGRPRGPGVPLQLLLRGQPGRRRRRPGDRVLVVDRVLHPRQDDHRRLRDLQCQGVRGVRELLGQLTGQ